MARRCQGGLEGSRLHGDVGNRPPTQGPCSWWAGRERPSPSGEAAAQIPQTAHSLLKRSRQFHVSRRFHVQNH